MQATTKPAIAKLTPDTGESAHSMPMPDLERLCPIVDALLVAHDIPPGVACAAASMLPRIVQAAQSIWEQGGDPDSELVILMDAVEAEAIAKFQASKK